jgi:acetyl-CoA carboxylase biotin carboxyl carrier protein
MKEGREGVLPVEELAELLRLVARTDIEEIEVEREGARMLIRREATSSVADQRGPAVQSAQDEAPVEDSFAVPSPVVGIFRRSAGGKSEPPIDEGDEVTVGQVVGAVEAMGMLNRVQTDRSGMVTQVLVQDGQAVEYGQPLFLIRSD